MLDELHIPNNNDYLHIKLQDDKLDLSGIVSNMELKDNNLILFLYKFITDDTVEKIKTENNGLLKKLHKLVLSKRKNEDECRNVIKHLYFEDYEECSEDHEALVACNASKYLKLNISDYIIRPSLDEYINSNIDILLTKYETIHDLILMQMKYGHLLNMPLNDGEIELWDDFDKLIIANWKKMETDTVEKYNNKEISIYGIRKVRSEIAAYKNVSAHQLKEFRPLKYTYETKYYKKKKGDENGELIKYTD